jgi:hypothetical protein
MAVTIGIWLIAGAGFAIVAGMIVGVIALIIFLAWLNWMMMTQGVWTPGAATGGPPFPITFATGWTLTRLTLYLTTAFLIALYCRKRFDRLAGRAP